MLPNSLDETTQLSFSVCTLLVADGWYWLLQRTISSRTFSDEAVCRVQRPPLPSSQDDSAAAGDSPRHSESFRGAVLTRELGEQGPSERPVEDASLVSANHRNRLLRHLLIEMSNMNNVRYVPTPEQRCDPAFARLLQMVPVQCHEQQPASPQTNTLQGIQPRSPVTEAPRTAHNMVFAGVKASVPRWPPGEMLKCMLCACGMDPDDSGTLPVDMEMHSISEEAEVCL